MNNIADFINHSSTGYFNDADLGTPSVTRVDGKEVVEFPGLGKNLRASDAIAKPKLAAMFGRISPNSSDQRRMDAAADFVSSGLKLVGSPADDIVRGDDEPYLFVPGAGRQVVIPSMSKMSPGHRTFAYKIRQTAGSAQWGDPNDMQSFQNADFSVEEKEQGAGWFGIAWKVSIPEMWESDLLGENVPMWREQAANFGLDDFDERVSSWGDTDRKIPGFMSLGDALIAEGGIEFASGTPDAPTMIRRIGLWEALYRRANREKSPTAALAPNSDRVAMTTTYFTGTAVSAWDQAVKIYPWLSNVTWSDRMQTASPINLSRWVLYSQNPSELYLERMPTMVFGPFPNYAQQVFILLRRTAGVVSKRPERVMYIDFTAS